MGSSSSVRIVSRRAQQGRCVYCHDQLAGRAAPCARCGAFLHADCRAQLTRCPTIGCAEPLLRTAVTMRRPAPERLPSPGLREGARPGAWARSGPRARLVASALLHLTVVSAAVAAGVAAALERPWTWSAGTELLLAAGGLAIGLIAAAFSLRRLARLPRLWGELDRLLDQSRPTSMVLDAVRAGEGRWTAQLRRSWESPPVCTIPLSGLLAPRWLRRLGGGQRVWVWGWPGAPGGPYLLELPDGRLAFLAT